MRWDLDETKTGHAVAVVNVPFTRQEWEVLRMQVQEMHLDVPLKTDCENFNFEGELGALTYPWALHISSGEQVDITRGKRREYDKLLLKEDGICQEDSLS